MVTNRLLPGMVAPEQAVVESMDKLTPAGRSANMRQIRSQGTKPELAVRSLVHRLGYRFRLHRKGLPGKPDLVFVSRQKVIFVHGCFWHGHEREGCLDSRVPKSNTGYWSPKLAGNKARDVRSLAALEGQGWKVMVIWECEVGDTTVLASRIRRFLG
jgi:DNA mismatch endonuclease (patch repair protein)